MGWTLPSTRCAREGGRGAASGLCTRMIDTSQTLPLALIGCVDPGLVYSCKSNYSHRQWIFTQLTCILFYCQIIMTVLANITQNSYRLQLKVKFGKK